MRTPWAPTIIPLPIIVVIVINPPLPLAPATTPPMLHPYLVLQCGNPNMTPPSLQCTCGNSRGYRIVHALQFDVGIGIGAGTGTIFVIGVVVVVALWMIESKFQHVEQGAGQACLVV
jgi:hypothetical protein